LDSGARARTSLTPNIFLRLPNSLLNAGATKPKSQRLGFTIKYADFVSNLESVSVLGPNFGEVYTREVAEALRSMHGGDETLRSAALVAVDRALR
jgi:hypothetical protein